MNSPSIQTDSLTVPASPASLAKIAAFVLVAADAAGLDSQRKYRLRLSVDELATNIMIYGYADWPADRNAPTLDILTRLEPSSLKIVLEDDAVPFDPRTIPEPDDLHLPLEQRDIGGLGVFLALTGVDDYTYERVGYRNRSVLTVNRATDE